MIKIVNYGLGNVQAFLNMYCRLGIDAQLASNPDELANADKIILPGVGAFDRAMNLLDASGMRSILQTLVCEKKVPVLGICVGMQILADSSEEGQLPGLGWIPGRVKSFGTNARSAGLPLPHMGWNDVRPTRAMPLLAGLETDARLYFLHSFYFECVTNEDVAASALYGQDFSCVVARGNVFGVQFHPEKSHHWGTQLLRNFADISHC